MNFHIVSDSSCDLGRERCRRLGITMVSFYAALGDETYYREEKDVSTREFYQRMAAMPGVFPKTSMPTVEDYLEAFYPLAEQEKPILCICLREEFPHARVHVMDSRLATVLQGLLVEEAVRLRDMGVTLEAAVAALEPLPMTGRIFFTTDDLEYLRHGGRIGKAAATTGTLLRVKPLIGYEKGELVTDGIAQGRKKSLVRVRELFFRYLERNKLDLEQYNLATGFGLDAEEHKEFAQQVYQGLLERGYDRPEVKEPYQIGITIGVHTGPTPLGVGLIRRAAL